MPNISVIMSIYNEPIEWIYKSIDSILNQTYSNFEFIIINDNPDNINLKLLLKSYASSNYRIIIIENERNIGLTKSLNIGLRKSTGKYIARMDADDIAMPERFQCQYEYMQAHREVDVCGTWAYLFGDISVFSDKKLKTPVSNKQIQIQAFVYNPMVHPSVMFRKERLTQLSYNEKCLKAQDYALWGELIEKGFIFHNIPKFLMKYRLTAKSAKQNYRSQQFTTADSIRTHLIKEIFPGCTETDISLHNKICNEQICDLKEAERWLLKLKELLIQQYSENETDVSILICRLWTNICLINGAGFSNCRNSSLSNNLSFFDFLRFAKRGRLF